MSDSDDDGDVEVSQDLVELLSQYGDSLLDESQEKKPQEKKHVSHNIEPSNHKPNRSVDVKKYAKLAACSRKARHIPGDVKNRVKQALEDVTRSKQTNPTKVNSDDKQSETSDSDSETHISDDDLLEGDLSPGSLHSGDDLDECDDLDSQDEVKPLQGAHKHLQKMREELGLLDSDFVAQQRLSAGGTEQHVCGADLRPVQRKRPAPEVIVFDEGRNKKKKARPGSSRFQRDPVPTPDEDATMFDLKRARHDVRRFGIAGLEGDSREDATVSMMVTLGAKAPKKECMNYRQLQEKRKVEKVEAKTKREWDRSMGYKVTNSAQRYTANRSGSKKDRNDIGIVDGQMGSYRGGVQKLTKTDIESVNKPKRKRNK